MILLLKLYVTTVTIPVALKSLEKYHANKLWTLQVFSGALGLVKLQYIWNVCSNTM